MISTGDLLNKEVVKKTDLGLEIEEYLNNFLYVPDSIVVEVLMKYIKNLKEGSNIIIEGFPKTIYQAKYLINKNIIPDSIVYLNNSEEQNLKRIKQKFQNTYQKMNEEFDQEGEDKAVYYYKLYKFHIKQCKEVFHKIALEYGLDKNENIEDLARLLRYKLNRGYKNPLKFMLFGNDYKNKNTMIDKICSCFGVKQINVVKLVVGEIGKKNNIGNEILMYIEKKENIPDNLIFDLIVQRIDKVDVQLNGFLMDLTNISVNVLDNLIKKYLDINFTIKIDKNDRNFEDKNQGIKKYIYNNEENETYFNSKKFQDFLEKADRNIEINEKENNDVILNKIIFEVTQILNQLIYYLKQFQQSMNELNKIRGYIIKESQNETMEKKPSMEMKYFILGLDNQIYLTSNLALIQYLINNSNSIEMLYEKCERYLKKIIFIDRMKASEIKTHNQPEKFPFYNSKYFDLNLKVADKQMSQSSIISKALDELSFYVFSFDDDFVMNMHAFIIQYQEFISKPKKKKEFLKSKISILKNEEEMMSVETLNYKKHLENYKIKMRLLIKKMEQDKSDRQNGIELESKFVIEEDEPENNQNDKDKKSYHNKLVKLNNGSLYAGELNGNIPNGNGKEFLSDGSSYVGEFKNGFWHGSGYLVDSENFICYGEFLKGRVVGIQLNYKIIQITNQASNPISFSINFINSITISSFQGNPAT